MANNHLFKVGKLYVATVNKKKPYDLICFRILSKHLGVDGKDYLHIYQIYRDGDGDKQKEVLGDVIDLQIFKGIIHRAQVEEEAKLLLAYHV